MGLYTGGLIFGGLRYACKYSVVKRLDVLASCTISQILASFNDFLNPICLSDLKCRPVTNFFSVDQVLGHSALGSYVIHAGRAFNNALMILSDLTLITDFPNTQNFNKPP